MASRALASILVGMMLLAASTASANPGAEPELTLEQIREGKNALARFNTIDRFTFEHPQRDALDKELDSRCQGMLPPGCIQYLFGNRQSVIDALPNNPAYWQAFAEVMSATPVGFDPATALDHKDPRNGWQEIIAAAQGRFYLSFASGHYVDPEEFLTHYQNSRRLLGLSETLIEKMTFLAVVGIGHNQVSDLLAVYAAREDYDSIQRVLNALEPVLTS